MKFSTFLSEAKHKQSITTEKAIEIAKKYCSKSIANKIELWRGGNFNDDAYLMDSSHTVRRSANTSNHYTVVMDNIITHSNYPLRSKSFIMTADDSVAGNFGDTRRIIPFDDAKIGSTGKEDLWYVNLNAPLLKHFAFEEFAAIFNDMDAPDTNYNDIINFTVKQLKELIERQKADPDDIDRSEEDFIKLFHDIEPTKDAIESRLKDIFDPEKIGFKFFTGATATNKELKGECWLSGKALAVTEDIYDEIIKALK